jgi:hypothetical protein
MDMNSKPKKRVSLAEKLAEAKPAKPVVPPQQLVLPIPHRTSA